MFRVHTASKGSMKLPQTCFLTKFKDISLVFRHMSCFWGLGCSKMMYKRIPSCCCVCVPSHKAGQQVKWRKQAAPRLHIHRPVRCWWAEHCGSSRKRHARDVGVTWGDKTLKETEDPSGAPEPKWQQALCLLRPPPEWWMTQWTKKPHHGFMNLKEPASTEWMLSPASKTYMS